VQAVRGKFVNLVGNACFYNLKEGKLNFFRVSNCKLIQGGLSSLENAQSPILYAHSYWVSFAVIAFASWAAPVA